jgi:hypothetical protein
MEEVMREYVHGVLVRKRDGKFRFRILDVANETIFKDDPLILLDGLPVFDADKIMNINPLVIERIDVVTAKFLHGNKTYPGIVSFHSYNGDLPGHTLTRTSKMIEYISMERKKEFYQPLYDDAKALNSRMPDYRNALLWKSDIKLKTNSEKTIEFYSSDNEGKYLIVVEGISEDGIPGFATKIINIEPYTSN